MNPSGSTHANCFSMNEDAFIVFDVGATKTRVALARGGSISDPVIYGTPQDPEEGIHALRTAADTLLRGKEPTAACGGVPGTVERESLLVSARNLPPWGGVDLGLRLSQAWGIPTTILNDGELVALGEYYFGAGKGERNMLYVTVSTGVGGAHIVDGRIDKGRYNAEIGHQVVNRGELEDSISGTAVQKRYGVHPKEISDPAILNELADILAQGLYDNVLHWSPEVVVLGGSMIVGKNGIPVERVSETLSALVTQYYPAAPDVRKALLGDIGGLYGGLAYFMYRT